MDLYYLFFFALAALLIAGLVYTRVLVPRGDAGERCFLELGAEGPIFGASFDALLIVDPMNGDLLYGDRKAFELYGMTMEGRSYKSLGGWESAYDLLLQKGERFKTEHERKDGSRIPLWVATAGCEYRGKEALILAVKKVEESEMEREARIRKMVIDATDTGIGTVRGDGKECPLIDANPALLKAFEMPREWVVGVSFFNLLPEQEEKAEIQERMLKGKGWSGEIRVDEGKGERFFFLNIDPIGGEREEERFFALICQDITEKRVAENRLVDAIVETQERERKRMANDLHDGVGQTLTAANVYLKSMEKKWRKGEAEKGMKHLPMVSDLVLKGVEEIRSVSHDLMPDTLREQGLIRAIRQMLRDLEKGAEGMEVHFHTSLKTERRRPEQVDGAMYRICQELVNNSLRHAKASELSVALKEEEGRLILEAEDDGKGFDPRAIPKGSGIEGMQERASSLGGEFRFDSTPGKGSSFQVELPLNEEKGRWEKNTHLV